MHFESIFSIFFFFCLFFCWKNSMKSIKVSNIELFRKNCFIFQWFWMAVLDQRHGSLHITCLWNCFIRIISLKSVLYDIQLKLVPHRSCLCKWHISCVRFHMTWSTMYEWLCAYPCVCSLSFWWTINPTTLQLNPWSTRNEMIHNKFTLFVPLLAWIVCTFASCANTTAHDVRWRVNIWIVGKCVYFHKRAIKLKV